MTWNKNVLTTRWPWSLWNKTSPFPFLDSLLIDRDFGGMVGSIASLSRPIRPQWLQLGAGNTAVTYRHGSGMSCVWKKASLGEWSYIQTPSFRSFSPTPNWLETTINSSGAFPLRTSGVVIVIVYYAVQPVIKELYQVALRSSWFLKG